MAKELFAGAEAERAVGITVEVLTEEVLTDYFALDEIKGFGPQKFKELHKHRLSPTDVIESPERFPGRR